MIFGGADEPVTVKEVVMGPERMPVRVTVCRPRTVSLGMVQVKVTVPWELAVLVPIWYGVEFITAVTDSPGAKPWPVTVCWPLTATEV